MPVIVAILLAILIIALTRSFILNALALRRDLNKRFDDLRARLEDEANSTVDHLLNGGRDGSSDHGATARTTGIQLYRDVRDSFVSRSCADEPTARRRAADPSRARWRWPPARHRSSLTAPPSSSRAAA